jgi:probable rRNA maturation factor
MIVYEPAVAAKLPRAARPRRRELMSFLREALALTRLTGEVSVLLTGDRAVRDLNRQFRRKNKSTDVLSFPATENAAGVAGDLVISLDTALRQATERGHSLETEIKVLLLHGLLHLAGYDHETDDGEMQRREVRLRRKLGLPGGLIERVSRPAARTRRAVTA